jgi:hypothetical protein
LRADAQTSASGLTVITVAIWATLQPWEVEFAEITAAKFALMVVTGVSIVPLRRHPIAERNLPLLSMPAGPKVAKYDITLLLVAP